MPNDSRYDVDPDSAMIAKIVYFAHDLSDPAVHRRVRMLVAGGAAVTPIGFRRSAEAPSAVEGLRPIVLGQTADGMLVRRMLPVVGALVRLGGHGRAHAPRECDPRAQPRDACAGDPRAKALRPQATVV
jgi:hypothetical protein